MTTEQMDWIDDQINAGKMKPRGNPWELVGTCDWGDCDRLTEEWRWSAELETWLPVCKLHAEDYRPWWRGPRRFKRGEKEGLSK